MRRGCLFAICLALCSQVEAQSCQDLKGQWENELGSVVDISEILPGHVIHGTYHSSSGVDGKKFPLQGWVNNNPDRPNVSAVAFSVRWEGYGSITSWTGYCDTDDRGPFLRMLWHLVRPAEEHTWERVITNSSVFRPQ